MKAHEVRALIADPIAKSRRVIEQAIISRVLSAPSPISCYVELVLSPVDAQILKDTLYGDGFSVKLTEVDQDTWGFNVIWHEKARTVRGPLASGTISDTGSTQPNGDRQ